MKHERAFLQTAKRQTNKQNTRITQINSTFPIDIAFIHSSNLKLSLKRTFKRTRKLRLTIRFNIDISTCTYMYIKLRCSDAQCSDAWVHVLIILCNSNSSLCDWLCSSNRGRSRSRSRSRCRSRRRCRSRSRSRRSCKNRSRRAFRRGCFACALSFSGEFRRCHFNL